MIFPNTRLSQCFPSASSLWGSGRHAVYTVPANPKCLVWMNEDGWQYVLMWAWISQLKNISRSKMQCSFCARMIFFFFHQQNHYSSYCLPHRDGMKMNSGATIHLKVIPLNVISVLNRRRQWHPTPVLLPGRSHGWRSLVGCSPWGR